MMLAKITTSSIGWLPRSAHHKCAHVPTCSFGRKTKQASSAAYENLRRLTAQEQSVAVGVLAVTLWLVLCFIITYDGYDEKDSFRP